MVSADQYDPLPPGYSGAIMATPLGTTIFVGQDPEWPLNTGFSFIL